MVSTKDSAQKISYLMPKIARRILFSFFESVDIPQTQLFAILTLSEHGSCRFTDLARELRISAPTATGIVDRLERSGYARRVPDKKDRRVVNIELTDKGLKVAKVFRQTIQERWQDILEKLPTEDREQFLQILMKIHTLL